MDTDTEIGEGFEFAVVKTTGTLFNAFGLMNDVQERSVELSLSSDGAELTHTISHVAAGLKFNNVGMRDPSTKRLLLLHTPDSLFQSRNLCFPLLRVIAKDSNAILDGFRTLYGLFNTGQVSDLLQWCLPFMIAYTGDMATNHRLHEKSQSSPNIDHLPSSSTSIAFNGLRLTSKIDTAI